MRAWRLSGERHRVSYAMSHSEFGIRPVKEHVTEDLFHDVVPTKNLIRTVCVTDRAVLGRRTITSVGMADVRSVEVDGRLASFGRSSGRRVSVHGLQAPAIRGCGQAACRW